MRTEARQQPASGRGQKKTKREAKKMSDTEQTVEEKKEVVEDLSNSDVVTKYKAAADIVKVALEVIHAFERRKQ